MTEDDQDKPLTSKSSLGEVVGAKAARKLRAQHNTTSNIWFGLGMMGLIGWSVAIPTLLGAVVGLWLDQRYPGDRSWTLALLVAGLVLGCFNAWRWIDREEKSMREQRDDDDE